MHAGELRDARLRSRILKQRGYNPRRTAGTTRAAEARRNAETTDENAVQEIFSDGTEAASDNMGDVSYTYDQETDTLVFTGSGAIPDAYVETLEWRLYQESARHVIVEKGITIIGTGAFLGFVSLETVVLPEGMIEIGTGAFADCDELREVNLPESLKIIEDYAFQDCGFTELYLPTELSEISGMVFYGCNYLQNVRVSDKNRVYSSVDGIVFSKDMSKIVFFLKQKVQEAIRYPNP